MKKISIFIFTLVLISCSKEEQKKAGVSDETAKEAEKIVSKNGGEGCYIPYQAKACELVDKTTIAQIVGIEAKDIEVKDAMKELHEMGKNKDKPYKGSEYANCDYSWKDKSGKTYKKKVTDKISVDMPVGGYVQIGNFTPMKSIESFKQMYRNVSQEEVNKAFDKADDKLKEKGFDNKQITNAKELGKELTAGRNVTYLEGIGEAAALITSKMTGEGVELIVLINGNTFKVSVNIDLKNQAENLSVAKEVAKEVLKKCE
ncbi:MAG: hypothetical protein SFU27_10765 [Thermonemataceae bacterium]|nr:hypothetical protein [Thermonemataceae bacterium]